MKMKYMKKLLITLLLATAFLSGSAYAISPGQTITGHASYYGKKFHGRTTANGERYNMNGLTCAHKHWKFGTKLKVSYNGKSVIVRVNDRGPFIKGRMIDLSKGAARKIGMIQRGVAKVKVEVVCVPKRGHKRCEG